MKHVAYVSALLLLLLGNRSTANAEIDTDEILCRSIAGVDLKNTTINGSKFVEGEACTSDSADLPEQCDWKDTIARDELLRPVPGKEVRLVILHTNHETGSGAYDTVLVFDCIKGSMKKMLQRKYLYGVQIKKNTDAAFSIISGDWQQKDPLCCPSKEKQETFRWNAGKSMYFLEQTTITPKTDLKR